jgi:soluble lytic murein transglycosylase
VCAGARSKPFALPGRCLELGRAPAALRIALAFLVLVPFLQVYGAQSTSSSDQPAHQTTHHSASSKKGAQAAARARRVSRLHSAFVASADLKPMARQLLETRSHAAYAGVESYARSHAQTDAGGLAWLALGYAHLLDHDYPKAIDALKRAQPHTGELRDYADYFLADAYAAQGQSESVTALLRDFAATYPDSLFLRDAMHLHGAALAATGHAPEAVKLLETYRAPTRPDIEMALGRAYAKTGRYAEAAEAFRRVYYAYPTAPEAADARLALEGLAAQANLAPPTFAERKARANLLAQARDFSGAAREFRGLVPDAPPEERNGVTVALGVALHHSGHDSEARGILESVPETGDDSNALRWQTLAEMARSAGEEERFESAVAHLRQTGSASDHFAETLLLGGNMYLLQKNYDKAIDYYRELQVRFPNNGHAPYAHWKAAWLTERQGRREEAKKEFEEQVSRYPASPETPAALYWRARLAEEDGDRGRARAWYEKLAGRFPHYYYAGLARARLEALPAATPARDSVLDSIPGPGAVPGGADAAAYEPPADNVRYHRSLLLHNAGMTDFAVRELRAAAPEDAGWAVLQIARYYEQDGEYHRAMEVLKRATPGYFSLELAALPRPYWEALFPRPYWNELTRYSRQNELDPYLVASLIRQESEFNPGAISHADALGLMQLLPTTGRKVARELRVHGYSSNQLLAPNLNLQLGTRYFRALMDQFGGRTEYALAAYNAGTDRVQAWIAEGGFHGLDEFVESIPFTETREYVQAVVRNAAIYKRLYGSE